MTEMCLREKAFTGIVWRTLKEDRASPFGGGQQYRGHRIVTFGMPTETRSQT